MTIYVDKPRRWSSDLPLLCHMATDGELGELHEMAKSLGCKREWFDPDPRHPHYDIGYRRRAKAIKLGAVPVTSKELVERCKQNVSST